MEIIFWVLVICVLAYEAMALFRYGSGETISEIIWKLSENPIVPFIFGLIMGHFFWQRKAAVIKETAKEVMKELTGK